MEVFPCGPNPASLELFAGSCVLTTYVVGAGLRAAVPMDDREAERCENGVLCLWEHSPPYVAMGCSVSLPSDRSLWLNCVFSLQEGAPPSN
eukprot:5597693-Amphidinium_carterae.2